jgi:hypothetical protein
MINRSDRLLPPKPHSRYKLELQSNMLYLMYKIIFKLLLKNLCITWYALSFVLPFRSAFVCFVTFLVVQPLSDITHYSLLSCVSGPR